MARSPDIDARLVDYLYGELSGEEAAAFEKEVQSDPELKQELEGFERTRAAFAELETEEPPQAVSAQLLHEAAKRAGGKRAAAIGDEQPGWLARLAEWFAPLARHPAASAAASLVLVAGVAGALYVRGVDEAKQPAVRSAAPGMIAQGDSAEEPMAEPTLEATAFDSDDEAPADTLVVDAPAEQAPAQKGGLGYADGKAEAQARLAERREEKALDLAKTDDARTLDRNDTRARKKSAPSGGVAGGALGGEMANAVSGADPYLNDESDADKAAGADDRFATSPPPPAKAKSAPSRQAAGRAAGAPAPAPAAATEPAPLADAEAEPASPASTRAEDEGSYRAYKQSADKDPHQAAKSLHGQLNRVLAESKDKRDPGKDRCRQAARIANDILDRDPEYYYDKVGSSQRLQQCSGFVQAERKSRDQARAAKSQSKSKSKKAKPAADTAASESAD